MYRVESLEIVPALGKKMVRRVKYLDKAQRLASTWTHAGIRSIATDIQTGKQVY